MNSPTHKANIINTKYQEIGIGVVNGTLGGIKTTLVVQHFGTPVVQVAEKNDKSVVTSEVVTQPETSIDLSSNVLAESQSQPINPLNLTKIFGVIIFSLIISVLFIDGYVTLKKGIHRMTGSTVSHIGFLLVILLFILYQQQGVIF